MGRGWGRGGGGGDPQPPASPQWAHGTAPVPGPGPIPEGSPGTEGGFWLHPHHGPAASRGCRERGEASAAPAGVWGWGGEQSLGPGANKNTLGERGGRGGDPVGPGPAKKKTTPRWQKNAVWARWPPSAAGSGPRVSAGAGGTTRCSHTLTAPKPGLGRGRRTPGAESDPTNPCWGSRAILPPSPACSSAHHQALADGCRSRAGRQGPTPYPKKRSRSRSQDVST